jgi:hypothetical protein
MFACSAVQIGRPVLDITPILYEGICVLLGYYAASNDNPCEYHYHSILRNISEERRSHQQRGEASNRQFYMKFKSGFIYYLKCCPLLCDKTIYLIKIYN